MTPLTGWTSQALTGPYSAPASFPRRLSTALFLYPPSLVFLRVGYQYSCSLVRKKIAPAFRMCRPLAMRSARYLESIVLSA
jgi:hypothetical protein